MTNIRRAKGVQYTQHTLKKVQGKRLCCTYVVGGKGRLGKKEGRIKGEGMVKRMKCKASRAKCKQIGEYR